jgi:hypothetical protein
VELATVGLVMVRRLVESTAGEDESDATRLTAAGPTIKAGGGGLEKTCS